jgi:predicted aldo/keto reductase-like oxidoreductase
MPLDMSRETVSIIFSIGMPFYVQDLYYMRRSEGRGKASDCIERGECEKRCPQRLAIRQFLKDVAGSFEQENQHP